MSIFLAAMLAVAQDGERKPPQTGGSGGMFQVAYKDLDGNGDGKLSQEEFLSWCASRDKNRDGFLGGNELRPVREARDGGGADRKPGEGRPPAPPAALIRIPVQDVDSNSDKKLSREELIDWLKGRDQDKDGTISEAELKPQGPGGRKPPAK